MLQACCHVSGKLALSLVAPLVPFNTIPAIPDSCCKAMFAESLINDYACMYGNLANHGRAIQSPSSNRTISDCHDCRQGQSSRSVI